VRSEADRQALRDRQIRRVVAGVIIAVLILVAAPGLAR
jgi:hypothetical protein